MKRYFLLFAFCFLLLCACGVKSNLPHPNAPEYPRQYPKSVSAAAIDRDAIKESAGLNE